VDGLSVKVVLLCKMSLGQTWVQVCGHLYPSMLKYRFERNCTLLKYFLSFPNLLVLIICKYVVCTQWVHEKIVVIIFLVRSPTLHKYHVATITELWQTKNNAAV